MNDFLYNSITILFSREAGSYQAAVVTHCHVTNFALSVSEAISTPDLSRLATELTHTKVYQPLIQVHRDLLRSMEGTVVIAQWSICYPVTERSQVRFPPIKLIYSKAAAVAQR